jgi:hypothetical protein
MISSLLKRFLHNDWINLKNVNLSNNKLQLEGAKSITKCEWPNLEQLSLSNFVLMIVSC